MNTELDLLKHTLNSHYGLGNVVEEYCRNDVTATQLVYDARRVEAALDKVYKFCGRFGIELKINIDPLWHDA